LSLCLARRRQSGSQHQDKTPAKSTGIKVWNSLPDFCIFRGTTRANRVDKMDAIRDFAANQCVGNKKARTMPGFDGDKKARN
jgi:hypothetical protein